MSHYFDTLNAQVIILRSDYAFHDGQWSCEATAKDDQGTEVKVKVRDHTLEAALRAAELRLQRILLNGMTVGALLEHQPSSTAEVANALDIPF